MSDPVIEVGDVWETYQGTQYEVIEVENGDPVIRNLGSGIQFKSYNTAAVFTRGTKIFSGNLPPYISDNSWEPTTQRNGWRELVPCPHEWIDTGMRRTYCKHCDATAELDVMNNTIRLIG